MKKIKIAIGFILLSTIPTIIQYFANNRVHSVGVPLKFIEMYYVKNRYFPKIHFNPLSLIINIILCYVIYRIVLKIQKKTKKCTDIRLQK